MAFIMMMLNMSLKQSIRNKLPQNRGVLRKDNDMELKVGREYVDDDGTKYEVLKERKGITYLLFTDGSYGEERTRECEKDTLLPPSIEYLQRINQPFGTLDKDVQEVLKRLPNWEELTRRGWKFSTGIDINYHHAYRLSCDYVEKPAYEELTEKQKNFNKTIDALTIIQEFIHGEGE